MNHSIINYLSKDSSSCGYCKSPTNNVSHGLWAHTLTVHDYQSLIDRGWRRCGLYCYKPLMKDICCPAYTIRCDAVNLVLSKSQKKVLRKLNAFLKKSEDPDRVINSVGRENNDSDSEEIGVKELKVVGNMPLALSASEKELSTTFFKLPKAVESSDQARERVTNSNSSDPSSSIKCKPGVGVDESKPKCKKAKLLRLERRKEKNEKRGLAASSPITTTNEKKLEDFIKESESDDLIKKLELTLVPSCSDEKILQESWQLFKKYQTIIHNDDDNTYSSFSNFLVVSPLQPYNDDESPPCGYGSFHQLYKLDGKLIAVGVIDVLPKCVSSVYFFYDPAYSHLSLGTYGSLRELELVRNFAQKSSLLNQYYLGFYIHSCPKMRYKGKLHPSYLLCPEAYSWHPITTCLSKFDVAKYCRLNDDPNTKSEEDDFDVDKILILTQRVIVPYSIFKAQQQLSPSDQEMINEYASLVGKTVSQKMFLRW